ncbi:MAG TPA: alpha/beta fold hydrolase [Nocardioidaceae bacterium]|nr:alpha/beta fold hydrolase [Nocardioidaceae bacterium]
MSAPDLLRLDASGRPSGLILMLHGGQANSHAPVDDRSASWRRSRWMQRQIAGRAHERGVSVWLLRYRHRGWNAGAAAHPSPVPDARWALDEARNELDPLPVVLLGHSMGARTAVTVADDPQVTGVVALAPWLPADEPVHALAGRRFAAAQGRADRITSFRATEAFVRRAASVAASTELLDLGGAGHYMFRRLRAWNGFAISRSLEFLEQHADR